MAEKRIHNPDKSSSADVSRVSRSHDQDGHHTHIWKKTQLLCPVTVLVDSQVSDRCPWVTCSHDMADLYDGRMLLIYFRDKTVKEEELQSG